MGLSLGRERKAYLVLASSRADGESRKNVSQTRSSESDLPSFVVNDEQGKSALCSAVRCSQRGAGRGACDMSLGAPGGCMSMPISMGRLVCHNNGRWYLSTRVRLASARVRIRSVLSECDDSRGRRPGCKPGYAAFGQCPDPLAVHGHTAMPAKRCVECACC